MMKDYSQLWHTLLFFSRLLALSIPVYFLVAFADLSLLQSGVAGVSYTTMSVLGVDAVQNGPSITVGQQDLTRQPFEFTISEDSTGWKSMLFFSALVIAVPAADRKKQILAIAIGLPLIFITNISRVLGIVFVERSYGMQAALLAHDYLWRIGLLALVFSMWLFWLKRSKTTTSTHSSKNYRALRQ